MSKESKEYTQNRKDKHSQKIRQLKNNGSKRS